ncbi:MAG: hypothetical protein A2W00_01710 [Candidatus Eisenbacteria bacterium RBG_16_71_46]|nr:MAG: hypothetical protein A2W00_01710 [Candidatus Eisenbacteria bacterium RBG_16_71_46]
MSDKGLGRDEGDIGVATVAMALGISVRQVQRLASEAGMPRLRPGRYDLRAAVKWAIEREVERRMAGGVDLDRLIERLRHQVNSGALRASGDSGRATR